MNLYFESSAGILFFVSLGKHLESNAKKNTSNSIKNLLNLIPEKALKLENDNTTREIEINDIKINDILLVKPGMKIPTDGIIIKGNSSIDEAFLTGESMPKFKKENDLVYTSSINLSSTIYVKSQKENKDSMITQIINLVEEASNSKAPISRIADKISRYFVPTILLLSLITFIIWMFIKKDFSFSIDRAISVLVISCPCALGLATPLSIMKGTKLLVDNHILVKSGEAIEEICKTDTIFLDKTGTITKGFPEVTSIVSLDKNLSENNLLEIAYSLEFLSNHPIAYSINKKAQSLNITNLKVDNFKNYDGIGISGYINDKLYFIGNKKSLEINNIEINDKYYLNDLSTCVFISTTNQLLGVIYIKDELKDNSIKAINNFTNNFKNVVLLSGDNEKSVKSLAKYLNISKYHYECLPQDKQKIIKEYQNNNHTVLMIGDGINDSLSLITSNVGISFKQGSDIAIDSSDFILMANDINEVNTALNISKKIIKNIKFNFFWAFIYNIIFIPIAMGILYKFDILLNPMFASIAMSMSSLCVVINSLLLNYKKEEK
jgi:Cu+-exporting ATPase